MSSDAQVQEMVEESVAHAFDDLKARQWIEAKLRAEETLAATRKALADCAAEMDADDKAKVEAAVESRGRASRRWNKATRPPSNPPWPPWTKRPSRWPICSWKRPSTRCCARRG